VLQCSGLKTGSKKAKEMKVLLLLVPVIACLSQAHAETGQNPQAAPRTIAALTAEESGQQTVQIFKDKIWMRKDIAGGLAFICDRGRIGSLAFDAYREKRYDQITCTLAQ